jgi:hypothetical protein
MVQCLLRRTGALHPPEEVREVEPAVAAGLGLAEVAETKVEAG